MSESALTPPKERLMCSALRIGARIRFMRRSSRRGGGGGGGFRVADLELGREPAGAPVLEGDLAVDMRGLGARVERVDERLEALGDEGAAHLARAGELAVIRVELLVQDEAAADLAAPEARLRAHVAIHLVDAVRPQAIDRREPGQFPLAALGGA